MPKNQIKLADLTPEQIDWLTKRAAERVETLPNGCIVPKPNTGGVLSVRGYRDVTYSHLAWMLANGQTPTYRIKTGCRTVGCCNADHMVDAPPRKKQELKRTTRLSEESKALAMDLYVKQKMRLQDIGDIVGVSAQSIHRLVRRERQT